MPGGLLVILYLSLTCASVGERKLLKIFFKKAKISTFKVTNYECNESIMKYLQFREGVCVRDTVKNKKTNTYSVFFSHCVCMGMCVW